MKKYTFSMDFWNDQHYKNFEKIAGHFRNKPVPEILEIGTFEGRTAFWLLENIPHSNVTVIDPDVGPHFKTNLAIWSKQNDTMRFRWIQEYSYPALVAMMLESTQQYDLIYIDGDHNACGVLEDTILAWRLLKIGGILLFDDYMMEIRDPWFYIMHKEFQDEKRNGLTFHHPKEAIDTFMKIYKGQYEPYIDNYQVGVMKFVQIDKLNLNHGDKNQKALYENNPETA